jgi:hypothetical protein
MSNKNRAEQSAAPGRPLARAGERRRSARSSRTVPPDPALRPMTASHKVCGTSFTSLPQYTGQVALGHYGREKAQKAQRKQRAGFLRFLCLFAAKCSAPVLSPRVLALDLGYRWTVGFGCGIIR